MVFFFKEEVESKFLSEVREMFIFSRKYWVIGWILLVIMLFTVPAFADWQKVPIKGVTFRETIPKKAL